MVTSLPTQYTFFLVCCLKPDCSHPICKSQNLTNYPTWYSGGPLVSYIPLPIPDPSRPWGRTNCDECKGMCYDHFLKPSEALKSTLTPMASPPSTAIKEAFEKLTVYPPPDHELVCNEVAKRVLLSPDQIRMWFKHLHAVKENQEGCCSCSCYKNKQEKEERESSYYCAACRTLFQEFTESVEDWIGCEMCDSWFHFV